MAKRSCPITIDEIGAEIERMYDVLVAQHPQGISEAAIVAAIHPHVVEMLRERYAYEDAMIEQAEASLKFWEVHDGSPVVAGEEDCGA